MSSILEQLKIKPVPQTKETVEIEIPKQQEQVSLNTRIFDKTKAQVFDRDAFMSKLTGRTEKEGKSSLISKAPKLKPKIAEATAAVVFFLTGGMMNIRLQEVFLNLSLKNLG